MAELPGIRITFWELNELKIKKSTSSMEGEGASIPFYALFS